MKLNGEGKIEREQTRTQTGERKERIMYSVIHQNMRVPGSMSVLQKRKWMGDCVSLYAYACVYVCMCVCTYVCITVCSMYIHVCMYICTYVCTCVCVWEEGDRD